MRDELKRIWKETFVTLIEALSRHLVAVTDENHENHHSG
jgi:hypothetical protein